METVQLLTNISTIIANIAIIISMVIALRQLFMMRNTHKEEHTRNLRQSTIEFYNTINMETKDFIDDVILKKVDLNLENINKDENLHRRVRRYLSLMERFSVGINSHMYDITIFDRIQGKTTLNMYEALKPYIDSMSERHGAYYYGEFISVIEKIREIRRQRSNAGYGPKSESFPIHE